MPRDVESLRKNLLASTALSEEIVDSFLYESLPVFSPGEARGTLERLKEALVARHQQQIPFATLSNKASFFTARDLLMATLPKQETFSHIDWELEIAEEGRRQGLFHPRPLLFGDTNWSSWCFGFVRNMATGHLELWRFDRLGLRGVPMNEWKIHFASSLSWTVFL